jgi:UDP-N-acetylglucosamine 2-epimerase
VLKLAPVASLLREPGRTVRARVCLSGQHPDIARRVASEVGLVPDVDLSGDGGPWSLSEALATILSRLDAVIRAERPRGVIVQGDTTTTLAGSLAGFHHGLPVFHVEAGLRTSTPLIPFPEEMNRRLISRLATLHFAATERARDNLLAEGTPPEAISVTGNTIVDALEAFGRRGAGEADAILGASRTERTRILVTLHRRENADTAEGVARALLRIANRGDVDVLWIRHPNSTSQRALRALGETSVIRVLDPQPYATFVALLERSRCVLTDSGGVQEEAPALGVPVLVLREETDRPEAVEAGNARIVGSNEDAIVAATSEILDDSESSTKRSRIVSPFGDGHAAERIVSLIEAFYAQGGRGSV